MSAHVRHAHLYGTREAKYKMLAESSVRTTKWTDLDPTTPFCRFTPQDTDLLSEYDLGWHLSLVMDQNGDPAPGIVTTQDELAISWESVDACEKVEKLLQTKSENEARELFQLCSQSQWNYDRAKKELAGGEWKKQVVPVLYRPFDPRWTVFNGNVAVHRRERVMRHMLAGGNLALISTRQTRDKWDVLATTLIIGHKALAAFDINFLFPLYLYPVSDRLMESSPWPAGKDGRRPNLAPGFVEDFAGKLGLAFVSDGCGDLKKNFGPEDVFNYAYAVFHSPTYRSRYAEFLKIDFPRLPLTASAALFRNLCALGDRLVKLHLLEAPELDDAKRRPRYPVEGDNRVEKPRYDAKTQRVYVNDAQYFEPVPPEVWEFHVGGYQVAEKWLKDRAKAGRTLSIDDLEHYARTLAALRETAATMQDIDKTIPGWPIV